MLLASDRLLLCFFGKLFDPHSRKENEICRGRKAEKIDDKIQGVGNRRMHRRVNGEGAIKVSAHKEHIEGLTAKPARIIHQLVHQHRRCECYAKDRHSSEKGAVLCLNMSRINKVGPHGKHSSVADHGLYADEKGGREHVCGIDHYADAREYCVRSKECAEGVVHLTLFDKSLKNTHVHRHSAELPGEGVPLEIPDYSARFGEGIAEIYLF